MIEQIHWPQGGLDDALSPFFRGPGERPIRATFYVPEDESLPPNESEALHALRELAQLSEIEPLYTEPGRKPHLEIGSFDDESPNIRITVDRGGGRHTYTGIAGPHRWLPVVRSLLGWPDAEDPDARLVLDDLVVARAHRALGQDLLVTSSPFLVAHRGARVIRETNPRTPSEAAQIVGLLLRCRENYTYRVEGIIPTQFNRGLFYLVLVRDRLPRLWRYNSACMHAGRARGDDAEHLAQSILHRCIRALQARDAIGHEFYKPQNNDTRDAMMYHFDYLTLLLAGVLDAQARVAHRAYGIDTCDERHAGFRIGRNRGFLRALRRSDGANLNDLVCTDWSRALMTLIYEPRNTIHGAGLPTIGYEYWRGTQPQASFVSVLPAYRDMLWDATDNCGTPEEWGLRQEQEFLLLEPYSYSVALVRASFALIDQIAAATDVDGLLPDPDVAAGLAGRPPEDDVFGEMTRSRLAVLG